mmetsp:Transcript_107592/g.343341  ORF Transcript_107592/g.343341 Transcript_107592/m.343341 type:complete len:225 (+) Transcript_107592:2590-3264(+)
MRPRLRKCCGQPRLRFQGEDHWPQPRARKPCTRLTPQTPAETSMSPEAVAGRRQQRSTSRALDRLQRSMSSATTPSPLRVRPSTSGARRRKTQSLRWPLCTRASCSVMTLNRPFVERAAVSQPWPKTFPGMTRIRRAAPLTPTLRMVVQPTSLWLVRTTQVVLGPMVPTHLRIHRHALVRGKNQIVALWRSTRAFMHSQMSKLQVPPWLRLAAVLPPTEVWEPW